MTFQQLRYISEIARLGSINKTAKQLFVSQSSISSAVKALEEELNIQIFQRSPGGVSVTENGRELLTYARSLLDQRDQVEKLFTASKARQARRLTVATQHLAFPAMAFLEVVKEYSEHNYDLCIKELLCDELLTTIQEDRCDLGIIFLTDTVRRLVQNMNEASGIELHEICSIRPQICVRRGHPLAGRSQVFTADLASYPCVAIYQDYSTPFDPIEDFRLSTGHRPGQRIYTTDRATIHDLLSGSDAYHICTGMLTPREARATRLIPLADQQTSFRLSWLKLKHRPLTPEAQLFLDLFISQVNSWRNGG